MTTRSILTFETLEGLLLIDVKRSIDDSGPLKRHGDHCPFKNGSNECELKSKQTAKYADVTETMEVKFDFGLDFADLVDGMFDVDDHIPVVNPVCVDSAVPVLSLVLLFVLLTRIV